MKIVILDGATANPGDNPWTEIEQLGETSIYPRSSRAEVLERAADAEIILTNKVVIDAAILNQLPNLKFIAVTATGYNVVDVTAARERGILVSNVPEYSTESVAQFVFAGLLDFIHRSQQHHDSIVNGEWPRRADFAFWLQPTWELSGKTMGIVGLGRIGRAVARIANAFGMKVVASSRTQREPPDYAGFHWLDVETLFSTADVISLHCPLTDHNVGFVNRELLEIMKPNSLLINTARGGIINEHDLAEALNAGRISGAILDVVSVEPILDTNPLLKARNCLLTPHMAWATIEARRRLTKFTAENIRAFLSGSPINGV